MRIDCSGIGRTDRGVHTCECGSPVCLAFRLGDEQRLDVADKTSEGLVSWPFTKFPSAAAVINGKLVYSSTFRLLAETDSGREEAMGQMDVAGCRRVPGRRCSHLAAPGERGQDVRLLRTEEIRDVQDGAGMGSGSEGNREGQGIRRYHCQVVRGWGYRGEPGRKPVHRQSDILQRGTADEQHEEGRYHCLAVGPQRHLQPGRKQSRFARHRRHYPG